MENHGFGRQGGFGERFVPVKVGEELDIRIEAVGEKGDGIAKKNGFVLFVPNTKEGDNVKIKVTKVLRRVGFAEVVGPSSGPVAEPAEEPAPADSEDFGEEPAEEPADDSEDFGEDEPEDDSQDEGSDDFGEDDSKDEDEPEDDEDRKE